MDRAGDRLRPDLSGDGDQRAGRPDMFENGVVPELLVTVKRGPLASPSSSRGTDGLQTNRWRKPEKTEPNLARNQKFESSSLQQTVRVSSELASLP